MATTPTQQNKELLQQMTRITNEDVPVDTLLVWDDLYPIIDAVYDNFHTHLVRLSDGRLLEQFLILLRGSSRHQADNTQLLQQDLTEKGTIGFLLLRYGLPRFVQELTQGLQTLLHIDQTVPSVTDIDGTPPATIEKQGDDHKIENVRCRLISRRRFAWRKRFWSIKLLAPPSPFAISRYTKESQYCPNRENIHRFIFLYVQYKLIGIIQRMRGYIIAVTTLQV